MTIISSLCSKKTGKDLLYGKYVGWLFFLDEIV